jgi:hypothetical protein
MPYCKPVIEINVAKNNAQTRYASITEAARARKIPPLFLIRRVKGNYKNIKYNIGSDSFIWKLVDLPKHGNYTT